MSRLQSTVLVPLASFSLCIALAACDAERGSTPPEDEAPAQQRLGDTPPPNSEAQSSERRVPEPTGTRAALRSLYTARHIEDLPSRESIEAHPGGEDAVRWIAQHDDAMAVRARALASLQLFPNAASEAVIREVLSASDNAATIRSAAVRALQGWDLSHRADLRALAVDGLKSEDVPVATAAAQVLANVPEATDELQHKLTESPPPAVERAVRLALE